MFKIEYIGNIYVTPTFNEQELRFFDCFHKSSHHYDSSSSNLGLYDLSDNNDFIFNNEINSSRIQSINPDENENIFPFFKSFISFTEKSLKFDEKFLSIKSPDEFNLFIDLLAQSFLFHFNHFFSKDAYSKIIDSKKFHFLQSHDINGTLYFKLSNYGSFHKVLIKNSSFQFFNGSYNISINGKNFIISTEQQYDFITNKKLSSAYDKLTLIDIKNNAIFENGTEIFYDDHDIVKKLLNFKRLDNKFLSKDKEKLKKI